jgi:alkylation response protein AidB-like acyl-CoA dehydrogenase
MGRSRPLSRRAGWPVLGKIAKMGYKGIDTTELVLDECRVPSARVLGERPGQGFYQMMDGIEVGRVNVAARACGLAHRAFEPAIAYAQHRDAPMLLIGEGAAEIQKMIIGRRLLDRFAAASGRASD